MSSTLDFGGIVAPIVVAGAATAAVAAAAVLGAGWAAWQGGKLVVNTGAAMHEYSSDKKAQAAEQERRRKEVALANHAQLVEMARGMLSELERQETLGNDLLMDEKESLKKELKAIISGKLPGAADQIESVNLGGFAKLEGILARQQKLGELRIRIDSRSKENSQEMAALMKELRVAMLAATIRETRGKNLIVADPSAVERNKLNDRLEKAVEQVVDALEHVTYLSENLGMTESSENWFHSCFDGVDEEISKLSAKNIDLKELKEGITRLEDKLDQYRMLIPSINASSEKMKALYDVYANAAGMFGMKVVKISKFKSAEEIEEKLKEMQARCERAQECAELYRKMGRNAYICYAWDQELAALGYNVHSRKEIMKLANVKPEHATLDGEKIPFYQWSDEELTQLYSISDECDMQVIVHKDGTVSMQTLASGDQEKAAQATKTKHCSKMKQLHENLSKNWFLMFDYEEVKGPEEVVAAKEWFNSDESGWNNLEKLHQDEFIEGRGVQTREEKNTQTMKQS